MVNYREFIYNNELFRFNRFETFNLLLNKYNSLPLSFWKELLITKDSYCNVSFISEVLRTKINNYDKSSEVNSFYYKDKKYWYDKATRVGLSNLANYTDKVTFVIEDEMVELASNKAKEFLSELEIYAAKCYVNTQKHLKAIEKLETVEDIINYDYTSGYPDKITLNE